LFDDDGTGAINLNNLKRVAKELGETMTADELKEMLERAAGNGEEISFEDFYNIMTKKANNQPKQLNNKPHPKREAKNQNKLTDQA